MRLRDLSGWVCELAYLLEYSLPLLTWKKASDYLVI